MMAGGETNEDAGPTMHASVFRILGARRAVCWLEMEPLGSGGVMEVEVIRDASGGSFMDAAIGAHAWAPRRVRLSAPLRWNAGRGVLEVGGVSAFGAAVCINKN